MGLTSAQKPKLSFQWLKGTFTLFTGRHHPVSFSVGHICSAHDDKVAYMAPIVRLSAGVALQDGYRSACMSEKQHFSLFGPSTNPSSLRPGSQPHKGTIVVPTVI